MDQTEERTDHARLAVAYHRRRLAEMEQYELSLQTVVFASQRVGEKYTESDQNLLRKPLAYQTLVVIWAGSPFSSGARSWAGWVPVSRDDPELTVYALATHFAGDGDTNKLVQYINRVVEAAARYHLVARDRPSGPTRKMRIRATELLHDLMSHQALSQTKRERRR